MKNDAIARLAAANPVPNVAPLPATRRRPTRLTLALAVTVAITLPAIALGGRLADLLGLSNPGTPVGTSSLSLAHDTKLDEAMQELGFPQTLQLLGSRDGIDFYAARRSDGDYCFAIESDAGKGVGCDISGEFPSTAEPVFVFPPFRQFAGYAADGVATVAGLDASGATVMSAPVVDNLFASSRGPVDSIVSLEALDAQGNVIWSWHRPGR